MYQACPAQDLSFSCTCYDARITFSFPVNVMTKKTHLIGLAEVNANARVLIG